MTLAIPKDVAVIGAGTMGHALALVHVLGGCNVRLQDTSASQLAQAPTLIAAALDTLIAADSIAASDKDTALAHITTTSSLNDAVADAELIVEAVVENRKVKQEVFQQIDDVASDTAIIASNTSHLDIFPLIPARRQPHAMIAHWYTPPYIIDLVDIAAGPETLPAIIDTMQTLYQSFGKKPVVFKKFLPGYIANRLQAALGLEIYHLLDEGLVSAQDIDDSVIHGLSLRMATLGFLKKADFTGIDMTQRAIANQMYNPPPVRDHSETVDKLMAQGRTGVMAGAGFFDYHGQSTVDLLRDRDVNLLKLKATLQAIQQQEDK